MVNSVLALATIPSDMWIEISWDDFLAFADDPTLESGRFYYDERYMRIEMAPLGSAHAQDNTFITSIIFAYGMLKDINIQGLTNATFRKTPISACQPDMAFYVGKDLVFPPHNNSPVNLNQLKPPNLVVEIAATSLVDDTSHKLKLYQRLGVWEYWVVDVAASRIIATCLSVTEITHIRESQVLPGLKIDLIELALRRSSTEGHIAATRWLLANLST